MIFKTIDSLEWRIAPERMAHIFEKNTEDWSLCGSVTPWTNSHWVRVNRTQSMLRCSNCEHCLSSLVP